MNINKTLSTLFLILLGSSSLFAQVKQKVVVEHFTNTRCGICASKNPGLFNNLKNYPDVIHLAVHPSRPYSSCVLSMHNPSENDDRTKYYSVYGSTPRLAVQGKALAVSTNFSSSSFITSAQGKTTPISIRMKTLKHGDDSTVVEIVLKTEADHSLGELMLYVPAVEDTVFYNAPNGEKEHYDVFRKVLLNTSVTMSKTVGDSVVFMAKTKNHADWDAKRMYAQALLQEKDNKTMVQAETTKGYSKPVLGVEEISELNKGISIYPNPVKSVLNISLDKQIDFQSYALLSLNGTIIQKGIETSISTSHLKPGTYLIKINSKKGSVVKRFVVAK